MCRVKFKGVMILYICSFRALSSASIAVGLPPSREVDAMVQAHVRQVFQKDFQAFGRRTTA